LILRKVVLTLAAVCAIAASVGVAVVAVAFAVFALLRDHLGPAGAAAVVAGVGAVGAALGGVICARIARPPARPPTESLSARILDFARERPAVAAAAALAVGLIAVRNPRVITTALTAFLAGKATPKK
jgi:hypothetical protein